MKKIPLSVPNLNGGIIENLTECIETGWVSTGGRFIGEFEEGFSAYIGTNDAVSVQSGTAGLHLALRIFGVGQGDEVIAPTLTFIAAVNPIRYLGAEPVFMDCDDSLCMDPKKLERFCRNECDFDGKTLTNKKTGNTVKAVVVVHVFGNMADMERITDVAGEFGLKVLEDATEALGSYYTEGRYAGKHAGTIGDMGVYSFNANKIITTGGGGMMVSKYVEYTDRARYLSTTAKDDPLYFIHNDVGYNYRMLNIQAALGVEQLKEIEDFISVKKDNYKYYKQNIKSTDGREMLEFREDIRSNYWFYSLVTKDRDDLLDTLIDHGVEVRPVWRLCHKQVPYINNQIFDIEKAIEYEKTILNLPCSTNLKKDDIAYICDVINNSR